MTLFLVSLPCGCLCFCAYGMPLLTLGESAVGRQRRTLHYQSRGFAVATLQDPKGDWGGHIREGDTVLGPDREEVRRDQNY